MPYYTILDIELLQYMSKNRKQNTWAKYPWENTPGKFIEEVPLSYICQTSLTQCDYFQISLGLIIVLMKANTLLSSNTITMHSM